MGIFDRSKNKRKEIKEIKKLIINLKSENNKVRTDAANSLVSKGDAVVEFILPILKDAYSGARGAAVYALGKIGDKKTFEPILERLKDENIYVQSLAISALGRLKDKRAVDFIVPFLDNFEKDIRISAVCSLHMIGDPKALPYLAIAFVNEDDKEVVKLLSGAIISQFSDRDKQERILAMMDLSREHTAKAVALFIKGLSAYNPDYRWVAAGCLGRISDVVKATEPLIRALKDKNTLVRLMAAEALGRIGSAKVSEPVKKLLEDSNNIVQEAAKRALNLIVQGKEHTSFLPKFIKKIQKGVYTYEKYWAENTQIAKKFLVAKKVDRPNYYVIVETPEADRGHGLWGRDKDGLYLTSLFAWQQDLQLADCEGFICKPPTKFSLQQVAQQKQTDNFVADVRCGNCGHEWSDGFRYRNLTIVQCPNCKLYNKVDSNNVILKGY